MSPTTADRPLPIFIPVPFRARHDGWTPTRQARFIFELAATRCVDEACRRVGLSQQSAYNLRDRPDAESFRAAWTKTLERALPAPDRTGRAIGGTVTPIFYAGRQIGERRRYDNRLATHLLRVHGRVVPGAFADRAHPSRATGALRARRAAAAAAAAGRRFSRRGTRTWPTSVKPGLTIGAA